ncbi:MAG: polysaccharide biosynthesis tyrosine autokinase [Parasphingorhabdus sp.]|uniref:GumC family protein n=1 Tax=Parasphingorhabdus sp. TaxID=2709688 RepID=UPI003002E03A
MTPPNVFSDHNPNVALVGHGSDIVEPIPQNNDDRLNLGIIRNILRRRLWLLLSITAFIIGFGIIVTLLQPKIYTANAVVQLTGSNRELAAKVGNETEPVMAGDADVSTQIQVVGSLKMARQIVEKYKLAENFIFNPYTNPPKSALMKLIGGRPEAIDIRKLSVDERSDMDDKLVQYLRSGLGAARIGTSYSIGISYRHHNPEIAAMLANAYVTEYAESQVTEKKSATSEATGFLRTKVEELRAAATADFAAVQNYRVGHGLLSTSGASLTEQDISVYNQQTATAKAEAAADRARLNTARRQLTSGSKGDDVGEALESSVVSSLRSQRGQLIVKVADLRTRYGTRHPELQRAQQELGDLDQQIQEEIDRVISNLEARANVSEQRLASLTGTLGSAKGTLVHNNKAMVALDDLERRAEASQGLYESYLARYRETLASSGTERSDARILTLAEAPNFPSSPNIFLNILFACLVGLGLGLLAAFITEMQFRGLTTGSDVERRTGLPFLGISPENSSLKHRAETALETVSQYPNSVLAESMRSIYSSVHMSMNDRGQVLAISSAVPDEGKSILSSLLGLTAAAIGTRTIIVDCDIFRHGLSRNFSLEGGSGILEVASGKSSLDEALRTVPDSTLSILPIISRGGEGDRLTNNGAIQAIVAQLKERFDLVILDCPPLLAIAEAREIAALADGVILAARWRSTSDDAIRSAARLLPPKLNNYIGVVLTRVNLKKQSRYAPDDATSYYSHYQKYAAVA